MKKMPIVFPVLYIVQFWLYAKFSAKYVVGALLIFVVYVMMQKIYMIQPFSGIGSLKLMRGASCPMKHSNCS